MGQGEPVSYDGGCGDADCKLCLANFEEHQKKYMFTRYPYPLGGPIDNAHRDEETRLDAIEKQALAEGRKPCASCNEWIDGTAAVLYCDEWYHARCVKEDV